MLSYYLDEKGLDTGDDQTRLNHVTSKINAESFLFSSRFKDKTMWLILRIFSVFIEVCFVNGFFVALIGKLRDRSSDGMTSKIIA